MDRDALLQAVRAAGLPDAFVDQLIAAGVTQASLPGLIAAEVQRRTAPQQAQVVDLPIMYRAASATAIEGKPRSFAVQFSKGTRALNYIRGIGVVQEELDMSGCDLSIFQSGRAPVVDTHMTWSVRNVLGVVDRAEISGDTASAEARMSKRGEVADLVEDMRDGIVANVSIGYRVQEYVIVDAQAHPPVYRATKWQPYELTLCAVPVDPEAHVRAAVRSASPEQLHSCEIISATRTQAAPAAISPTMETLMDRNILLQMVRAAGLPDAFVDTLVAKNATIDNVAGLIQAERARVAAETAPPTPAPAAPAVTAPAAPAPAQVDVNAERAQAAEAERTRVSGIHEAVRSAGLDGNFAARLVDGNVALDAARAQVLEELARRSQAAPIQGSAVVINDYNDAHRAAVENALLHRYDPSRNALTELGRQYRGLTLMEMGDTYLGRAGISLRGMERIERAGVIVGAVRAAGMHGTSDFPNILANVAHKTLRRAYEEAPQTWRPFTRPTTANDFKPINRIQLGEAPKLEKIPASGEYKYGTIGDGKESYQLATYGKIVAINRQTIINDDLDAFTRLPELFGRAARDMESDIVWGIITGNHKMSDGKGVFDATHNNIASTGVTELNVEKIGEARTKVRNQKGLDGKTHLNLEAPLLLLPSSLETKGLQLTTQLTPAQASNVNPYAGKLTPIVEARLEAKSATTWYMAALPAQVDMIEVCWLAGQQGVYTETRIGFEVDGIELKVREDFAAAPIDWRGFVKCGA